MISENQAITKINASNIGNKQDFIDMIKFYNKAQLKTVPDAKKEVEAVEEAVDLESLSFDQLKAMAKDMNVKGYGLLKTEESLIRAIKNA